MSSSVNKDSNSLNKTLACGAKNVIFTLSKPIYNKKYEFLERMFSALQRKCNVLENYTIKTGE